MTELPQSPAIEHLAWGVMQVSGLKKGKDMKLWPGGGRAWDWRETNTEHVPGTQVADIVELIDHGASVIVLSRAACSWSCERHLRRLRGLGNKV